MSEIAILGAGAFGTALAISQANAGRQVSLVARSEAHAAAMSETRRNADRLPGVDLPDGVTPTTEIPGDAPIVLAAVPSQVLRDYLKPHAGALKGRVIMACNKGIDRQTGLTPTATIASVCPDAHIAVLSGPSFAADIARGLPTALTIAATDVARATDLQSALATETLRLYRSTDVTGVELGGALKNVIAIAAGLAIGSGLGQSARAALMTRGYVEMTRYALAHGAAADTLAGLSGFGDLVLTCTSDKSRNFAHGLAFGRDELIDTAKTVEGVETARIVSKLAHKAGIDVPITDLVNAVLSRKMTIQDARAALLSRPLKEE